MRVSSRSRLGFEGLGLVSDNWANVSVSSRSRGLRSRLGLEEIDLVHIPAVGVEFVHEMVAAVAAAATANTGE